MREQANEIIVALLQSKDFADCLRKAVKPELHDDLTSEIALILLETDPARIVQLSEKRQLTFYTVKIILRLAYSKTSPFYKKFRVTHQEFKDTGMLDDFYSIVDRKEKEEVVLSQIEQLDWYEQEMVNLYMEVGTFRNMNKRTNIPVMSCFKAVSGAIKKIQKVI